MTGSTLYNVVLVFVTPDSLPRGVSEHTKRVHMRIQAPLKWTLNGVKQNTILIPLNGVTHANPTLNGVTNTQ